MEDMERIVDRISNIHGDLSEVKETTNEFKEKVYVECKMDEEFTNSFSITCPQRIRRILMRWMKLCSALKLESGRPRREGGPTAKIQTV